MNNTYYLVLWFAFVISSSIVEGMLFHNRRPTKTRVDIHVVLNVMRGSVLLMIPDLTPYIVVLCTFTFPFIHDGIYYETRNYLSDGKIYPRGFVDHSETTTAFFSFNFIIRLILFVVGVTFFAFSHNI